MLRLRAILLNRKQLAVWGHFRIHRSRGQHSCNFEPSNRDIVEEVRRVFPKSKRTLLRLNRQVYPSLQVQRRVHRAYSCIWAFCTHSFHYLAYLCFVEWRRSQTFQQDCLSFLLHTVHAFDPGCIWLAVDSVDPASLLHQHLRQSKTFYG